MSLSRTNKDESRVEQDERVEKGWMDEREEERQPTLCKASCASAKPTSNQLKRVERFTHSLDPSHAHAHAHTATDSQTQLRLE